jgi:DNA-binding NtrC family response regulator
MGTHPASRILLVSNEETDASRLADILGRAGYWILHTPCRDPALKALKERLADLVILRACGKGMNGLRTLAQAPETGNGPRFVVLGDGDDVETAVLAIRLGAFDFLEVTVDADGLLECVQQALRKAGRIPVPDGATSSRREGSDLGMIGTSPPMRQVWDLILRVAPTTSTVLLTGETGTGKEVAARVIHRLSARQNAPLVPISCAALPEQLPESELFGHRKGSFKGATNDSAGLLEIASGGTVFLDEVETLTAVMQGKLLRTVEEKTVQRVGSRHDIPVDFRLIVATNVDLHEKVRKGSFREDLFFRLKVFPIEIPPLRHRPSDIPILVSHFTMKLAQQFGVPPPPVPEANLNRIMGYSWPGNLRQLKHCVERAFILSKERGYLDIEVPAGGAADSHHALYSCLLDGWDLGRLEEEYIRVAMSRTAGHRNKAAELLGIDRRTLYRKLKKIAIEA